MKPYTNLTLLTQRATNPESFPRARATLGGMTKWEYSTVPLIDHVTKQILDQWGDDGWELVQVVTGPTGGLVAYMKREKA
ncbi:hypothetical protein GCM10025876_21580 [Demequina litorisediminis]|uniref:DUF4177 domain-containing protein n=2 Tax=Demequinaceae TaxID=1042322 RepID=A0ABQ6IGV8_9MICO|nr:hypothetical protein GCM10025876_21580 [Demequina litorisediminis]